MCVFFDKADDDGVTSAWLFDKEHRRINSIIFNI